MHLTKSGKKPKVVLDTNNLVSSQINKSGASNFIYELFAEDEIELLTSPFQLKEFEKVLNYSRIKKKYKLTKKAFGIFDHVITDRKIPLVRGFDDYFSAPHSRHTENRLQDLRNHPELIVVAYSEKVGSNIVISKDGKQIFIAGHLEYNPLTLKKEYERDKLKGFNIDIPENYFPDNNPAMPPVTRWRAHANLLFSNWLNYYVYQETPYLWE